MTQTRLHRFLSISILLLLLQLSGKAQIPYYSSHFLLVNRRPRHFYPDSHLRFPALAELPHLNVTKALLFSSVICMLARFFVLEKPFKCIPFRHSLASTLLEIPSCRSAPKDSIRLAYHLFFMALK